ncbi:hypothetical protein UFOVP1670_35 [uncultured Caudovirales phage]|uniref:Uncharacterized protein n=1 Tax=uncultured Caudovirales phage TaxID=2100421 RepID=A0A6J5T6X1_9CAUD|nr:hypothetical protein UFOVP1670_35 [uncultured Caudovirales phage]
MTYQINTYRCRHFKLQELVGPAMFKTRGDRAWEMLDSGILITSDQLRDKFGAITINNWEEGGPFKESGLRDWDTSTGAQYSMHKMGKATDWKFQAADPQEVQAYVIAHPEEFPYLTTMENAAITKTWLHGDTRNHNQNRIWVVNP